MSNTHVCHTHINTKSNNNDQNKTQGKRLQKYRREWEEAHPWLDSVSGVVYKANCKMCQSFQCRMVGFLTSDSMQQQESNCRRIRTQKTQALSTVLHTPIISWDWYGMLSDIMSDFLSGCAFAKRCQCMGIAYFSKLLWFDWLFRMLSF